MLLVLIEVEGYPFNLNRANFIIRIAFREQC